MTFLEEFYSVNDDGKIVISAAQGSRFAKLIANDFNPIHDEGSRRFCVPGDLLFAIALAKYGVYEQMRFSFLDLLAAEMPVQYPEENAIEKFVINDKGRETVAIEIQGDCSKDQTKVESLVRSYVAFSGQNFPKILIPLMRDQGVMFNPQRPLVIYENMTLNFSSFDFKNVSVELSESSFHPQGKRGDAVLKFHLFSESNDLVGSGSKTLVLGGLRTFDEEQIQDSYERYLANKARFQFTD